MHRTPLLRLTTLSRQILRSHTSPSIPITQLPQIYHRNMSDAPQPSGLVAKSGLELLTWGTPNGHKIHILLEELKEAYGLNYTVQAVNIMQNTQKEPWFTKLGPNGRIPVLVDHDKGGHAVMEGSAILAYLERFYDPKKLFDFDEQDLQHSNVEQWVAWQHGGLGPMQGQGMCPSFLNPISTVADSEQQITFSALPRRGSPTRRRDMLARASAFTAF